MKNTPILITLATLLAVFAGCTTNSGTLGLITKNEATSYPLGSIESGETGFLVGSFSYFGHNQSSVVTAFKENSPFMYNEYGYFFHGIEETNSEIIGNIGAKQSSVANRFPKKLTDFELDEGEGYVFAIELPKGQYEFYDFLFSRFVGFGWNWWRPDVPFSVKFTITPGEATYVGEIRAIHEFGKNMLGMRIPNGGTHTFLNAFDRDQPLLFSKYPFLHEINMVESQLKE